LVPETVSCHPICDTAVGIKERPARAQSPRGALLAADGRISLVLPQAADVDIRMYAADGRRLAVLARGRLEAGVHRLFLPASAAPGVYVVNGRAGDTSVSVKVLKL